ncbi:aldehyde dehydrogenase family protein [Microbacterium sp. NPDC096154]|uniref:aldehyde dehydrogenase family protein n=1 Tax=Microbacterium sp. NPDC096154 TaxID=3155549 RepID=UPI003329DB94
MRSHFPTEWLTALPYVGGRTLNVPDRAAVADPADRGTPVGAVALAGREVADAAAQAARAAFPAWRDLSATRRGDLLLAAADAVQAQAPLLAELLAREAGKVLHDARGDVLGSLAMLRSFVQLVRDLEQPENLAGRPGTGQADVVRVRHVPVGPAAVIGPWNTPVFLTFNGVAPSLASGCTVVVKPAAEAPLALTALLRLMAELLPAGVLNVVPGRGSVVGQALVEHPAIRAVMFTGGTETGRRIQAAAAGTVKKVALELGGNDPAIVLADARLDDRTITELVAGSFGMSGQICFNIKRIYVHRSRCDEFVERFTAAASRIVVGAPLDPDAHIGPMTTPDGYANAQRLIREAQDAGAVVRTVGVRAASARWDEGNYVAPTVVTDIARDAELVLEEQFAPIIPIIPFDTEDEVIAEANRTEFGLASSVWSSDLAHAEAVAARIEAGNTYLNAHRLGASVPLVPFGGIKQSGLGRTHGMHSLEHCTELHAIVGFSDASAQLPGIEQWSSITDHLSSDAAATEAPTGEPAQEPTEEEVTA